VSGVANAGVRFGRRECASSRQTWYWQSHIAKAVANQAVLQGYKVQYLETDDFFARFNLSEPDQQEKRLRNILDCDLLILDDLFLSRSIPDAAGALLQTLVHQRYKLRRSTMVTSNRVVQDWGAISATIP
jgi:DNA replication protein DnaC